jgi:GxxExxY protein
MIYDDITREIIGSAIRVHATLGPGLLESAYRVCLYEELVFKGLRVEVETPIPLNYRGRRIDAGYRIDLLVEHTVLVELKALAKVMPVHEAQLLSYLRLGGYPVGLLINFHVLLLRDGIRRMVNQMTDRAVRPRSPTERLEQRAR